MMPSPNESHAAWPSYDSRQAVKKEKLEPGDERILDLRGLSLPEHTKFTFCEMVRDVMKSDRRMDCDISSSLRNIQDLDVI